MSSPTISHDYLSTCFYSGLLNERIDETDIVTSVDTLFVSKKRPDKLNCPAFLRNDSILVINFL